MKEILKLQNLKSLFIVKACPIKETPCYFEPNKHSIATPHAALYRYLDKIHKDIGFLFFKILV